jgi:NAD+ synthase
LGRFLKNPDSILNAAPTDGLFGDDRTDEEQLGASYDELEWAMLAKESKNSVANYSPRELEVLEIYSRLNKNNQHKMQPIPVCFVPELLKQ